MYLSCQCGGRLARPGLGRFLGDDSATILAQVCPSGVGKSPCTTESVSVFTSFLQQAISSRFLPAYTTATGASSASACSGIPQTSTLSTIGVAAGAAGGGTAAIGGALANAGVVSSEVPIVGTIVGLIGGILSIFGAHHAAAVQEQDSVLCQAVPAVNNLLSTMDAALAAGTLSPSDANTQYSSLLSQFTGAVKADPSFKMGDALYGYMLAMQAVIAQRVADLNAGVLTSGAPGPWTQAAAASNPLSSLASALGISSAPASGAATSNSSLLWIVALGAAALLFLF